jgi:hypothetical protein
MYIEVPTVLDIRGAIRDVDVVLTSYETAVNDLGLLLMISWSYNEKYLVDCQLEVDLLKVYGLGNKKLSAWF